jgi:hypothetical protein
MIPSQSRIGITGTTWIATTRLMTSESVVVILRSCADMCTAGGDKTLLAISQGPEMMRTMSLPNILKNLEKENGLKISGKSELKFFLKHSKANQNELVEVKLIERMENMQKEKKQKASWKDQNILSKVEPMTPS